MRLYWCRTGGLKRWASDTRSRPSVFLEHLTKASLWKKFRPKGLLSVLGGRQRRIKLSEWIYPGGVGHGPRDQFCPITSLQMADRFFLLCAGSLFDSLLFSPFNKWFTIIFFGKVWVDRCSKPQFLKQYDVCLFSIDIVRCNSSCA